MCGSMVDIQSETAEIRQRKKKKKETGRKYICPHPAMQGGHKKKAWAGHTPRTVSLLTTVTGERMEGCMAKWRNILNMLSDLIIEESYEDLKRRNKDSDKCRQCSFYHQSSEGRVRVTTASHRRKQPRDCILSWSSRAKGHCSVTSARQHQNRHGSNLNFRNSTHWEQFSTYFPT